MTDERYEVEYDSDEGVYRARYDWDDRESLSTRVVSIVTRIAEREPTEITPIHFNVDPDSLDRLFAPRPNGTPRHGGTVTFELEGYDVTVDGTGSITVLPP